MAGPCLEICTVAWSDWSTVGEHCTLCIENIYLSYYLKMSTHFLNSKAVSLSNNALNNLYFYVVTFHHLEMFVCI